jgi:hypothetical protein
MAVGFSQLKLSLHRERFPWCQFVRLGILPISINITHSKDNNGDPKAAGPKESFVRESKESVAPSLTLQDIL